MEILLSICLGICLSAAVGFRIFVPLLVMSIASLIGHLNLSSGFEWIGTYPAIIAFSVASIFEIAAYYIPFIDNLLDSITTPAAVIAGAVVMASTVTDVSPFFRWTLAIIAGSGAAGIVNGFTTVTRAASSTSTAGIGNPVVSTSELGGAATLSVLGIFFPLVIGIIVIVFLYWASKRLFKSLFKTKNA